jgi:hypothetical protein
MALLSIVGIVAWSYLILLLVVALHDPFARLNTRYAPGFSSERFAKVQSGDSRQRVIELLGEPLSRSNSNYRPGVEFLTHSEPKEDKDDFRSATIELAKDGSVASKHDYVTD